jgi:hypothetical protein
MRVVPRGVLAVAVALAFASCSDGTNESAVIFDPSRMISASG